MRRANHERNDQIVWRYFGERESMGVIAKKMGISRSVVAGVINRARHKDQFEDESEFPAAYSPSLGSPIKSLPPRPRGVLQ